STRQETRSTPYPTAIMSDALIFDENFRITSINSQKYDRFSRIEAVQNDCRFTLDINSDLYPCHEEENINLALASTLNIDGKEDPKDEDGKSKGGWREFREGEMSLADNYDYVCYGKVYKFDEGDGEKM